MPHHVELTPDDFEADDPRLALRRHTDRCFFRVEEVLPHADGSVRGFLVEGVLIGVDEVAELRRTGPDGGALPACET
ncbi:MAG: hypothetical protein AAF593_01635 [Planctomycetota bacterium]